MSRDRVRRAFAAIAASHIARAALLACGIVIAAPSGSDRYDDERIAIARAERVMDELSPVASQSPSRKPCPREGSARSRMRSSACTPTIAPPRTPAVPTRDADGDAESGRSEKSEAKPASALCTRKPNSMRRKCSVRYLA